MSMILQLVVGAGISIINISFHALATTWVIQIARTMSRPAVKRSSLFLIRVMIVTVSVLMLAHFCEVATWALTYSTLGVVPSTAGNSSVYFAFVNYTTLGYGDIVPVESWRLLGPTTAMNGVLLFGWSTAVIFEILRRSITRTTLSGPAEIAPPKAGPHPGG